MNSSHSHTASRQASTAVVPAARAPGFHQYSCLRCRLRKVKCDKKISGCAHCIEARVQCTFSARRPRKGQRTQPELTVQRPLLPAEKRADDAGSNDSSRDSLEPQNRAKSGEENEEDEDEEEDVVIPREMRDSTFEARFDSREANNGRLFVAQGRSRYINREKTNQIEHFETVIAAKSNPRGQKVRQLTASPTATKDNLEVSSLLTMPSSNQNLQTFHPPSEIMIVLWEYYATKVDIMVNILYKPTVETLVMKASRDLDGMNASMEALLFAIWLAVVTTMSAEECLRLHKAERVSLIYNYRHALHHALTRAKWMVTQEIVVLQALTLLLVFAPEKNARSNWMLSGITLSLAQAMGMHADSTSFSLSIIDTEVRRRIWWTLCLLDNRASEDCGLDNHIPLSMDTKLPLHINDSDLDVDSVDSVIPKTELTEMTMGLIKIEMAEISIKTKRAKYHDPPLTNKDIDKLARERILKYENTYLKYLDGDTHLHRLCYFGTRLIITKLWKVSYDASQKDGDAKKREFNEPLLTYNTDLLEIAHQLPDKFRQFGWFFSCKYTQWHAMAYLLTELCKHTKGPAVDRAWDVLRAVFDDLGHNICEEGINPTAENDETNENQFWQPLLRLLQRARNARKQALQTEQGVCHASSTPASGHEASSMVPTEYAQTTSTLDGLLGDPFLGSSFDFGEEMNWEQLDTWVESFQADLYQQSGADCQEMNLTGALDWW